MRMIFVGVLLGGCGSVSENMPDAASGNLDADTQSDAIASPCDLSKPFGTAVPVGGVNTAASETGGWLSEDLLTIYFSVAGDLHLATRAQPSDVFANRAPLGGGINTGFAEDSVALTSDGLSLFADQGSNFDGVQIALATRPNTAADFSTLSAVANINTTSHETHPWISDDGRLLYFDSDRSGSYDIFKATRPNATGVFGSPMPVAELNSGMADVRAVLSRDGLEIYFSRIEARATIYRATRATANDSFGAPAVVAELNHPTAHNYASWLSPDRCQVILSSDRIGPTGSYDLFIATRPQ